MRKKLMTLTLILSLLLPLTSAASHSVHASEPDASESIEATSETEEMLIETIETEEPTVSASESKISSETTEDNQSDATTTETESTSEPTTEMPPKPLPELELISVYSMTWTNQPVEIEFFLLEKASGNESKIKKLEGRINPKDDWTDIITSRLWTMRENGTLYLRCTAEDGRILNHEISVANIDTEKPSVIAGINESLVSIRTMDNLSGVAAVYVNDHPFAELHNGNLNLRLQDYDTYFEELLIYAVDRAGNRSLIYSLKNPYYIKPGTTSTTTVPKETQRPENVITPSPVTDAKGTITTEATAGKGTVTENTVIPVATNKPSNLSQADNPTTLPTTTESTTVPDETLPPRTDTDQEPTITGSANLAAKEFLSIKTKSGKIFYLIIDRTKTTDNVYLVTEVDEADLMHFTNSDGTYANTAIPLPVSPVEVTLPKPSEETPVTDEATEKPDEKKPLSLGTIITIIMLLAMAVGGVYYLKVIRPKQQYPSEADFYDEEYMEDMGAYPDEAKKMDDDEMDIT